MKIRESNSLKVGVRDTKIHDNYVGRDGKIALSQAIDDEQVAGNTSRFKSRTTERFT